MRKVFMTVAAAMFATAANAQETALPVGGSVGFEISENAAGKFVGTTTLGLTVEAGELAFGGFDLESVDGGNLTVDGWHIGANLGFGTVSLGDQGDLFVGNDFEVVGGTTLAEPTEFESVIANVGDASVMVAFTDLSADAGDVESIQGAYDVNLSGLSLTAVGDYNFNSEDYILGGKAGYTVGEANLGGIVTYTSASEAVGYEASVGYSIVTAFVNGDDTDALQNIGAGIATNVNGLDVYAEGAYNLDTEVDTIGAGISFSF